MTNDRADQVTTILRLTFGLVPIVAGLDKFTNLLVDWTTYLSPHVASMLPIAPRSFMMVVGVIEIAAGLLVLVRTRIGAYVVTAWLLLIALNLVLLGRYDVAVRDVVMAVSAFCLARLAESPATASRPVGRAVHA